jgi:transcriptional regulator with XRE-family HTH domain
MLEYGMGVIFVALFKVHTLIKELRLSKGLTQEQLSEGICAKDSLSRIERGIRRPDWYVFKKLMERLGENPRKYYSDIVTADEKRIIDLKEEVTNLLRMKNNESDHAAELTLDGLETEKDFRDGTNRQFILMNRATLAFHRKDYAGMLAYATEAIKITKPDFREDAIDTYVLFFDEIKLINQIAVASFYLSSIERSTNLLLKLKASLDRGYDDFDEKSKTYLSIVYNITKNLGLLKRYEECSPLCDQGIELCQRYRNSYYHPMFLYNKACCLLHCGRREESISFLDKAHALFNGTDRLSELSSMEDYLQKQFGIDIRSFTSRRHDPD